MPRGGMKGHRGGGGRPRKPIKLHLIEGTLRKDRHSKRLAEEPPPVAPGAENDGSCPAPRPGLRPEVRKVWEEMRANLKFKIFSGEDVQAFEQMVLGWVRWKELDQWIADNGYTVESTMADGRTQEKLAPQVQEWNDLNRQLLAYWARFGMTPADRARVRQKVGDDDEKTNPDDEFAAK